MLGERLRRLLALGSAPFGPRISADGVLARLAACDVAFSANIALRAELGDLLAAKNGWYAFESALNVFGVDAPSGDLCVRNAADGWRGAYGRATEGLLFFAEDLFGGAYALDDRGVVTFDPETGEREFLAPTLEQWAGLMLDDYRVLTGQPLAHAWQSRNGALPHGVRLAPMRPFVLGGAFDVDNLQARETIAFLRERARLAATIAALPDGAQIAWPLTEHSTT